MKLKVKTFEQNIAIKSGSTERVFKECSGSTECVFKELSRVRKRCDVEDQPTISDQVLGFSAPPQRPSYFPPSPNKRCIS